MRWLASFLLAASCRRRGVALKLLLSEKNPSVDDLARRKTNGKDDTRKNDFNTEMGYANSVRGHPLLGL
jgi:hypothetical protein